MSKRKLDNIARLFSLDDKKNKCIFGYSVLLKETINKKILKQALNKTLEKYNSFKVKMSKGLFWSYLEDNDKNIIIKKEDRMLNDNIDNKDNNDYLFKISYYKNKININIFHVLTDGVGAISLLKSIIYNYLNIKYNLTYYNCSEDINVKDEFIKKYDKKYKDKFNFKKAFLIPNKNNPVNTCHYIIKVDELKRICNQYKVTITEYITALYAYSIFLSFYKSHNKKDIVVAVPINLRKYYNVNTISNFFSSMNINPGIIKNKLYSFDEILSSVVTEFKNKLNKTKIKQYLTRDVKLGQNKPISLIPLNIKKFAMKHFGNMFNSSATTTLSNVGRIDIDNNYSKYINNIFMLSKPWKLQSIKCSICSFENNLNITINSNININCFHTIFLNILKDKVGFVRVINDV